MRPRSSLTKTTAFGGDVSGARIASHVECQVGFRGRPTGLAGATGSSIGSAYAAAQVVQMCRGLLLHERHMRVSLLASRRFARRRSSLRIGYVPGKGSSLMAAMVFAET